MAIQKLTPDPQIPFPPTDTEAQKNLDEWADQITFQLTKMIFSLNTSVNRLIDKVRDAIVFATTTYTIKENDATILANATGGAFSVTLPTAVGLQGQRYFIKKRIRARTRSRLRRQVPRKLTAQRHSLFQHNTQK